MARFSLVITSDRVYSGEKKDEITPMAEKALKEAGHELVFKTLVRNEEKEILGAIKKATEVSDIVLVTGGTGISPRDISVDAAKLLAKDTLPGFGEFHRSRSLSEIGYKALLSRAAAFIVGKSIVAVSPGSPSAVKIALEILIPIADHARDQLNGVPHS